MQVPFCVGFPCCGQDYNIFWVGYLITRKVIWANGCTVGDFIIGVKRFGNDLERYGEGSNSERKVL